MTIPGPTGEDDRPLAGPAAGMGLPESGTQHATSSDVDVPLETAQLGSDPLTPGAPAALGSTPPPASPTPPAYDDPSELVQEPTAYDEAPGLPLPEADDATIAATPAYDALAQESGLLDPAGTAAAGGTGAGAGALTKVKAFADQRPAAFLGMALAAGWLVGKLFSSSDDDS
jgi:hypothetical protein